MKAKVPAALAAVLLHEGGYSNHPSDSGGATMWALPSGVYDNYRKSQGNKPQAVKQINSAERVRSTAVADQERQASGRYGLCGL
ncbi:glycosyl hydrolase 108 family protein [Phyllobacterium sp. SB3]|uniref:glycosyl hydrolase 108 family protein n=1 Tax=Phyllobacterium sp. SB3 TaxID=3156073 RepID=UPI0032AEEED5